MKRASLLAALGGFGLWTLACSGESSGTLRGAPHGEMDLMMGASGGEPGGDANTGAEPAVAGAGGAPVVGVDLSQGVSRLRVLTESEFTGSVTYLLGELNSPLDLPADLSVDGFTTVGSAEVAIRSGAVSLYEAASHVAATEVFADDARWQALVGCTPQDLADPCVATFVQTFGRRAFRRDLTQEEVQQWVGVGQEVAQQTGSPSEGLSAVLSGLLQSPNFLYRVETNSLDETSGRLVYDGPSMATRLSFLLAGRTPSDELLNAAAAGQLDTAEGIRAAAEPLLNAPNAVEHMSEFFKELSQAELVMVVDKSAELFPSWRPELQASMLEAMELFIKRVVLAPDADVRSFFNSDQTFVDANLAPIYGVAPPAAGFEQLTLSPETGRAGILTQAGFLTRHSVPDHSSPTRRGLFITLAFLCRTPPSDPGGGVITELPDDPTLTTRERLELIRAEPSCGVCHALIDPPGLALEHFDSIGQYRETEDGKPIDVTGELDGVAYDGAAELGAALAQNANAMSCMVNNFYRSANAVRDPKDDAAQLEALSGALTASGYVWRDFVAEFVASDAFRSAPAPMAGTD